CKQPLAQLENTRFKVVQDAQNWAESGLPKVAGVNAFGFGGINAHAVLEAYEAPVSTGTAFKSDLIATASEPVLDEVLLLARHTHEELLLALEKGDRNPGDGVFR